MNSSAVGFPVCSVVPHLLVLLVSALVTAAIDLRAQGSRTPPGAPAPSQKSLQEFPTYNETAGGLRSAPSFAGS